MGGRMGGLEGLISGLDLGGLESRLGGQIGGLGDVMGGQFGGLNQRLGDLFAGGIGGGTTVNVGDFGGADKLDTLMQWLRDPTGLAAVLGLGNLPTTENLGASVQELKDFLSGELGKLGGTGFGVEEGDFTAQDMLDMLGSAGQGKPASGEDISISPSLPTFAPIDDYSRILQDPLMAKALENLTAANPYDARMNAIISGQDSEIDRLYDDKASRMMNTLAVTRRLGTPAAAEEMRKLEDDRAQAKAGVRSQFGMAAAGAEQGLQTSRLGDLGAVLTQELGRQTQLVDQQRGLRGDAMKEFQDYFDRYAQQYNQPQALSDEGLRLLLGGMGVSLSPGQALSGAVGAGGNAVGGATAGTANLLNFMKLLS